MKKTEYIKKYGEAGYEVVLQRTIEWRKNNPEKMKAGGVNWRKTHPEKVKANDQARSRKGGKRYKQRRQHQMTGIPHKKELVRCKHKWTSFKKIIAPGSQIHHEWIPGTANYTGVALVEKDQHMHGFIDIIQILEGEITLLTEAEIRGT